MGETDTKGQTGTETQRREHRGTRMKYKSVTKNRIHNYNKPRRQSRRKTSNIQSIFIYSGALKAFSSCHVLVLMFYICGVFSLLLLIISCFALVVHHLLCFVFTFTSLLSHWLHLHDYSHMSHFSQLIPLFN